jgi:hypothetical protein
MPNIFPRRGKTLLLEARRHLGELGFGGVVDPLVLGCFEEKWDLTMKEETWILDMCLWKF